MSNLSGVRPLTDTTSHLHVCPALARSFGRRSPGRSCKAYDHDSRRSYGDGDRRPTGLDRRDEVCMDRSGCSFSILSGTVYRAYRLCLLTLNHALHDTIAAGAVQFTLAQPPVQPQVLTHDTRTVYAVPAARGLYVPCTRHLEQRLVIRLGPAVVTPLVVPHFSHMLRDIHSAIDTAPPTLGLLLTS